MVAVLITSVIYSKADFISNWFFLGKSEYYNSITLKFPRKFDTPPTAVHTQRRLHSNDGLSVP